ncbi:hypothetical protein C8R46DRAFT_1252861 [Mycena filopes]|nr:hypothetical protein C8R46DRAFT_1252861 [Mycena filopes]
MPLQAGWGFSDTTALLATAVQYHRIQRSAYQNNFTTILCLPGAEWQTLLPNSSLQELRVQNSRFGPFQNFSQIRYSVDKATLEPLLNFPNLVVLWLCHPGGFDLDDTMVEKMASAWPRMEILQLSPDRSCRLVPRITIEGIYAFATHCPHLEHLAIAFDATVTLDLQINGAARVTQRRLLTLVVEHLPIEEPLRVAKFLRTLFPRLRTLYDADSGLTDAALISPMHRALHILEVAEMVCAQIPLRQDQTSPELARLARTRPASAMAAAAWHLHGYGADAVADSRMELYGDVYCVVLNDWDITSKFLADPFTAFDTYNALPSFSPTSNPLFLYDFNTAGAPTNPAFLARGRQAGAPFNDPQLKVMQAQIDELRKTGAATVNGFQQVMTQQARSIGDLQTSQTKIVQGISALGAIVSSGNLLTTQNGALQGLLSQRATINLLLASNPTPQIGDQERAVSKAEDQVATLTKHFSPALSITDVTAGPSTPSRARESTWRLRNTGGLKCTWGWKGGWRSTGRKFTISSSLSFAISIHHTILFSLLFLSLVVAPVLASQAFRTFSINTNGLGDVMKMAAVQNTILTLQPNAWVVGETKSVSDASSRIPVRGYKLYESHGVRAEGKGRAGKWGVIVGIQSSFHAQRVEVSTSLQGRVVALDVVIPTSNGAGFCHRLIGIYAPWNPGEELDADSVNFWSEVTDLCKSASFSWSVAGDCNATTSAAESTAATYQLTPARRQYLQFLHNAEGKDLWMDQPDRNALQTFTCKGPFGQTIIDRVAHSTRGVLGGSISVDKTFIPATDHRPIIASIALSSPPNLMPPAILAAQATPSYDPRSIYPKRHEKHRFQAFSRKVEELVRERDLVSAPVVDETSWTARYNTLTGIFHDAAKESFEYPKTQGAMGSARRKVSNPTIKILVTESRRVSRLINATSRQHRNPPRCLFEYWTPTYMAAYHTVVQGAGTAPPSLVEYLRSVRRALSKLRYREEKAELLRRQDITSRSRINSALLGGSTKKLFGPTAVGFIGLGGSYNLHHVPRGNQERDQGLLYTALSTRTTPSR